MYNHFDLARKYAHYYITAGNGKGHGTHSPFVYDFITNVLHNTVHDSNYNSIEQLRNNLLHDNTLLTVKDFGAGSRTNNAQQRSIKRIAQNALKPKKFGQLFYRIVQHYGCNQIVELGTSLGTSTAYFATANNFGTIHTCEGSNAIATVAKQNFKKLFLENIILYEGEFTISYKKALENCTAVDLLYLDGNHQLEPTLQYFEQALPKLHNDSIVIFDDIHWSKGMEDAWETIKKHSSVSETVDLFFIGIAFFRKEQKAAQHFTIRF